MTQIVYFILALFIIFDVFLLIQSVSGKLLGANVEKIGFFLGPKVFEFNLGGICFAINALPFGCFVKFKDDFENLSSGKKFLIVLAGLLSYLIVGAVCLGLAEALHQVWSGFGQFFYALISPISIGSAYLERLSEILLKQSFFTGLGILASKFLTFNSLPFGMLSGGNLVIYALEILGLKSDKFKEKFNLGGLLIALPMYVIYLTAFVTFIYKSLMK